MYDAKNSSYRAEVRADGVEVQFFLFFWVHQQMQTHATMEEGQEVALTTGDLHPQRT